MSKKLPVTSIIVFDVQISFQKYLIAITPGGFICFISKGYGGRTSEYFVVNSSGFLTLIESEDQVLADTRFPAEDKALSEHNHSPHVTIRGISQFSRYEVLKRYSTASVRIHAKRSIQRIQIFKVL